MQFSKDLLLEIHQQIKPFINKTPVLRFDLVDELCECNVFFKCENFQKTGSFKIRAASNAIKSMPSKYKENGVITHSSGNFAQGLACASSLQDINAFIVMPDNAPRIKKDSVLKYVEVVIKYAVVYCCYLFAACKPGDKSCLDLTLFRTYSNQIVR